MLSILGYATTHKVNNLLIQNSGKIDMDAVFKAPDKKETGANLLNQWLTHLLNSFQVNELVQKK